MDLHLAAESFWKFEKIRRYMEKKSIQQIRDELEQASEEEISVLWKKYQQDERKGVQNLLQKLEKGKQKREAELQRLESMKEYEKKYQMYSQICGIDEAGRGPLAGPVVAGAVILPKDCTILYLNDSKQVSAARREQLYQEICEKAISYGVGIVSPERIDEINILQATYEAMRQAIDKLEPAPDFLLVDAVTIPDVSIEQKGIIKGDAKSVSIAAASILAKVTRDRIMVEYDGEFPEYGFAGHKGYGSKAHMEAIKTYGPCPIHRKSFIKNIV